MRGSSVIAVILLFAVFYAASATGATVHVYNMTVNYTLGYTPPNLTVVVVPGAVTAVSTSSSCSPLLKALIAKTDSGYVIAWQENANLNPGAYQRYLCNTTMPSPTPSINVTSGVLVATCTGTKETGSNAVIVDLVSSPYSETIYSYQAEALLESLNITVYILYASSNAPYNVYVVADGNWILIGSSSSTQTFSIGEVRARSIELYVNTSATGYYYVYIAWSASWLAPSYNTTRVKIDADYILLDVSGRGRLESSAFNVSFDGRTSLLSVLGLATWVNGTTLSIPVSSVDIVAYCYGANATSVVSYTAYTANVTRGAEARLAGELYLREVSQAAQVSVSVNASAIGLPLAVGAFALSQGLLAAGLYLSSIPVASLAFIAGGIAVMALESYSQYYASVAFIVLVVEYIILLISKIARQAARII